MVLFPKIDREYWFVTDFHEKFFAVPVKVTERGGLFAYSHKTPELFTVVWEIVPPMIKEGWPDGYIETYDASRRELYRTNRAAARAAARLNRKGDQEWQNKR